MGFETKLTPVKIDLPDVLDALWEEITKASIRGQERGDARFVFEEAEIEVAVAIEAKAESKLSLHVVEFGGGLTGTRTATLRIKVKQYTEEGWRQDPGKWVFLAEKTLPAAEKAASSPEEAETAVRAAAAKKSHKK